MMSKKKKKEENGNGFEMMLGYASDASEGEERKKVRHESLTRGYTTMSMSEHDVEWNANSH